MIYGAVIALSAVPYLFLESALAGIMIAVAGIMLPIPVLILRHHALIDRYQADK